MLVALVRKEETFCQVQDPHISQESRTRKWERRSQECGGLRSQLFMSKSTVMKVKRMVQ